MALESFVRAQLVARAEDEDVRPSTRPALELLLKIDDAAGLVPLASSADATTFVVVAERALELGEVSVAKEALARFFGRGPAENQVRLSGQHP